MLFKWEKFVTSVVVFAVPLTSYAFLDKLKGSLDQLQKGGIAAPAGGQGPKQQSSADSFNATCKQVLGAPFKERQLSASPDQVASKYFNVDAAIEAKLNSGINRTYQGSFVSLKSHIPDLKEQSIRDLAEAFNANPSLSTLAQVSTYAEV